MCLNNLFGERAGGRAVLQPAKRRALFFAINKYGGGNDLNGCINDQKDFIAKLNKHFPGFDIRAWTDSKVTKEKFTSEVNNAIAVLRSGDVLVVHYSGHGTKVVDKHGDETDGYDEAIYLIDGTVIDDDIGNSLKSIPDGATVVLFFDSCFSGTITRMLQNTPHPARNKFIVNPDLKHMHKKRIRFVKEEMKWIVFSGSSESQTSADAYIYGKYNGAFTYFALKTLTPDITYNEWIEKIKKYLPSKDYDQIPTLEGNTSLFINRVLT
jgi:hypothetical protein